MWDDTRVSFLHEIAQRWNRFLVEKCVDHLVAFQRRNPFTKENSIVNAYFDLTSTSKFGRWKCNIDRRTFDPKRTSESDRIQVKILSEFLSHSKPMSQSSRFFHCKINLNSAIDSVCQPLNFIGNNWSRTPVMNFNFIQTDQFRQIEISKKRGIMKN